MPNEQRFEVRDLRNGDWYWIHKAVIHEYTHKVGATGIIVYSFLASLADSSQSCFPSQRYIADRLGYSRATINRALDVDEALISVAEMANRYADSLKEATELREKTMGAFELDFSQQIDLDAFSKKVATGTGEMKLWLVETESQDDFKRFRGVDLHTWDRILMDVGPDFAYITVPGKGCINAAPRIAAIQGEDNAGKTSIYHDGVEVFA